MPYEIKELKGSLFPNEGKERDNQPDYTGNIKVKGKIWRLAAWETESRGGKGYLSISLSDPEEFKRSQEREETRASGGLSESEFARKRKEIAATAAKARAAMGGTPATRDFGDDFSDDDIPF
jgi:hypothetical protein